MAGIILYAFFLIIGFIYSTRFFSAKDTYFKIWMGGIFGNIILMFCNIFPCSLLGFTVLSHILLIIFSLIPLFFIKKSAMPIMKEDSGINMKVLAFVIMPVSLLIWVLLTNHILAPTPYGGVASGQSTYGDLQMHLGFVTSIAEQKVFPPNYPFLDGYKTNYPFLVNMLSSSLYLFGTPLRLSVLIPSYVITLLLVTGFYILSFKITGKKSACVLSCVLFFLGGGLGFVYFINGAEPFTSIFNEYYHTPTNCLDYNLRWVNPICDMIIPQRTTMAGWCVLFPALWLLVDGITTGKRKSYVILGVIAGAMPMIHTHSFLALGIISGALFLLCFPYKESKKTYIINWICYGVIALILALPQLFYWTFSQTAGNESFLRLGFNWVNETDNYFWFYIKNWGITALLSIPAIIFAPKMNKRLLIACGIIFLLAECVIFQPNEYDNNKLFFVVYMIMVISVSDWLIHMWKKTEHFTLKCALASLIIMLGTLSGTLTIIREYVSGGAYETFSEEDIKIAEYIRKNTPSDAVFLTGNYHLNPVVSLAGRNIYSGSSLYVYFHGFTEEYYKRSEEIKSAYSGTAQELVQFCKYKGMDYVYLSEKEIEEYKISQETFNMLEKVYSTGSKALYRIK